MELVAWRLENEADPRIGDEVEPDLVRRARCSAGDRAGKAPVDCAVQVAAQDAFDLGMACDDFGKSSTTSIEVASRNVTIFSICLQTQLSLYVTIFYQICRFHSYADYIGNLVFWSSHAMIAEESCVD